MLGGLKTAARSALAPLAGWLGGRGVHPNTLTYLGLGFAVAAGGVLALGRLRLALVPLVLSGLADMLDGAVARATGRTSAYGAALDSTVDRVSETAILTGLLLGWMGDPPGGAIVFTLLVLWSLAASFLVSYVRARAEGLSIPCTVGLMERPGRLLLLGLVLLLGRAWILPGLALLASLTSWTVVERLRHIRREVFRRANRGAVETGARRYVP